MRCVSLHTIRCDNCFMAKSAFLLKLGKRITSLRKERGMTQEDLEEASGKMKNTISNLERGLYDVKISTLISVAKALDVSLSDLVNVDKK